MEVVLLQLLDHVQHNILAREEGTAFQDLQNELQSLFLHDRAQELAATATDCGPQQRRYLLLILVHHQQLGDGAVGDRACRT